MKPTRLQLAMHEAGHAVVQLSHPTPPFIEEIWIVRPGEVELGRVVTQARWQPRNVELLAFAPDALRAQLVAVYREAAWLDSVEYLAGPIAEMRWLRWSRASIQFAMNANAEHCFGAAESAPDSDHGRVRSRLTWLAGEGRGSAFAKACDQAEGSVARHWSAIARVGRALADEGVLDHARLHELAKFG